MILKLFLTLFTLGLLSAPSVGVEHKLGGYKPGDNISVVSKFLNLDMECDVESANVNSSSPDLSVCTKNDDLLVYQFSKEYLHNSGFNEIVAVFLKDTLIYLNYVVDLNGEKTAEAEKVLARLKGIYGIPDRSGYFKYQGNLNKKYLASIDKNVKSEDVFISSSLADALDMEKVDFIQIWKNSSGVNTRVEYKSSIFGNLLVIKSRLVGACEKYPNYCEAIKSL